MVVHREHRRRVRYSDRDAETGGRHPDRSTGHYSSQVFGEAALRGTVKDRTFTAAFNTAVEGQSLTVTYSGTIEDADNLKGTVDIGGMAGGSFTARRKPPPDARDVPGIRAAATAAATAGAGPS
jgi:hypothetical protein